MSPTEMSSIHTAVLLLPFLAAAAATDLLSRRVPNVLIVVMLGCGIGIHLLPFSWSALEWTASGGAIGFFMLLPFYMLGGMGAGDVKLLAAAGTFLGPHGALLAALFTLIGGGVLGVGAVVLRRVEAWRASRLPLAEKRDPNAAYVPYTLAISAGSLAAMFQAAVLQW